MIKVVNVVQDFNTGGIQSVLLNLLRAFRGDPDVDYSVVVLEAPRNSEFDKIAAEEKLNVTYLKCSRSESSHYYVRKAQDYLSYTGKLLHYLIKCRPDVVHTHNSRMIKIIIGAVKRTKNKFVWVHTLHSDPYAVHDAHIPYIQRAVNDYGVHPVCLNETQFLKAKARYGLSECHYIYNIVDLERFRGTLQNRKACREKLGIPDDAYVIGTVGRLDPVKNYRFLVKSFALAAKKNENAILVFVGDGDEYAALKSDSEVLGVADRVKFLGTRRDTEDIYPAFDVFASTSISESSGLVILEAQAVGIPCVVSAACPVESVTSDLVVRMDDAATDEAWAEKLLSPSGTSPKRAEEADYSEESVKRSLKKLYTDLIDEKRR